MSANTFELIEEPSSIPLTLHASFSQQNKILKEMRFLHTAFDGIKLAILDKYKPPIILKGSICQFCYSIFEAKTAIEFKNNDWKNGEIPRNYQLQVQHYMAVTGFRKTYIAVLVGGNKFYWYGAT